ncbi:MAG: ABC transporter permease [Verrucomicrobia bacterium]|nr:ABC transporter permease [Verrucomicrobiota bacterium]
MADPTPSRLAKRPAPRLARAAVPLSPGRRAWRRFRRSRAGFSAALLLCLSVLWLGAWPFFSHESIAPYLPRGLTWSPLTLTDAQFAGPDREHWFGTDVHGRDLLSRVMHGARISLVVGLVGAAVSVIIGVCWGAVAGYVGGRWDSWMMRVVDALYAVPAIVLIIVLVATLQTPLKAWLVARWGTDLGPTANLLLLFVGLGAVSWLTMARIVRGQVLSLRERGFVAASRVLGASHARILLRHILPNVWGVVIVYVTLTIPSVILYESFLSYLGLGVEPPYASLGYLIADGVVHINAIRTHWWLIVFPGGALVGTLLALNLSGDGLRNAWEPREEED